MDRYKITMPDGSSTEEPFNSDKEAITCAVDANRGVSKNLVVEKIHGRRSSGSNRAGACETHRSSQEEPFEELKTRLVHNSRTRSVAIGCVTQK